MSLRPLFLLTLPLLATLLAPRDASACSQSTGLEIERAYPEPGSVDVPIDGVVMIVGTGYNAVELAVVVKQGDAEIAGAVTQVNVNHYVWRSDAPLLADTAYTVHVASDDLEYPSEISTDFTTGAAVAPQPGAPVFEKAAAEAWAKDVEECAVENDCVGCEEWKVVGAEQRLRLHALVAAPEGPFSGFYVSHVAYGPSADALAEESTRYQGAEGEAIEHMIDLAAAGEWPSDEVCMRGEIVDPLGVVVAGEVSCVDVSAINVEPEDETTGGSEGGDTAPTTGDGADSESSGDPSEDVGEKGCGCRSSDAPIGSAALLLGVGVLLRPRRRAA